MKILVAGSSGHLGEALVHTLRATDDDVTGVNIVPSAFTEKVGSITDRDDVRQAVKGIAC